MSAFQEDTAAAGGKLEMYCFDHFRRLPERNARRGTQRRNMPFGYSIERVPICVLPRMRRRYDQHADGGPNTPLTGGSDPTAWTEFSARRHGVVYLGPIRAFCGRWHQDPPESLRSDRRGSPGLRGRPDSWPRLNHPNMRWCTAWSGPRRCRLVVMERIEARVWPSV